MLSMIDRRRAAVLLLAVAAAAALTAAVLAGPARAKLVPYNGCEPDGYLRLVSSDSTMVGAGIDAQHAYHHKPSRPGATLYDSRDIVVPNLVVGRH
jgi:hypothetical protein